METQVQPPAPLRILRLREVEARTGLRRASIYRRVDGTFPLPIRLGANSSGWIEAEVDSWLATRIAERDAKAGAK